jgi:prolyl-tRNA synthetase
MHVWNSIRAWFQKRIEELGVEETSFPMFLSSKSLEKEKEHVEGFAPELAWVRIWPCSQTGGCAYNAPGDQSRR